MMKYFGQHDEEKFILAHSSRAQSIVAGKSTWQELREAGYITPTIWKEVEGHQCMMLLTPFLFSAYLIQEPSQSSCADLLTSIKPAKIIPLTHTQRPITQVILDLVKLTMSTNHHSF